MHTIFKTTVTLIFAIKFAARATIVCLSVFFRRPQLALQQWNVDVIGVGRSCNVLDR